MLNTKHIIMTLAIVLACTAFASCGNDSTAAESKAEKNTTTTETTTTSEPETSTTTEVVEESEPENKDEATTTTIDNSEPETTPTDETKHEIATTPVESMPENDEMLSVEECLKKLISENIGENVEITNIECNEIEGHMVIYLDNGMKIGTRNVASHYAAGDKTSIDNYEIDKDTAYDYFILYWG